MFLSRNYRLIVAPRKFDVLKSNICPEKRSFGGKYASFKNIKFPRGNNQTDSSGTKTLYYLYCSPLNFLPRALIRKRGSSITFFNFSGWKTWNSKCIKWNKTGRETRLLGVIRSQPNRLRFDLILLLVFLRVAPTIRFWFSEDSFITGSIWYFTFYKW